MGRININFHISLALSLMPNTKVDAVPAKDLALVLLNLPGTTHITGCVTGLQNPSTLYVENSIEAINDVFPDGTNVTVKYVRHSFPGPNGQVMQVSNYDGFVVDFPSTSKNQNPFHNSYPSNKLPGYGQAPSVVGSGSLGPCTSSHDWKTYQGFNDSYEYCGTCGVKK